MTDDATTTSASTAGDPTVPVPGGSGGSGGSDGSVSSGAAEPTGRGAAGDGPPGSTGGDRPPGDARQQSDPAARRRRRWIIAAVAGSAVLVLLVCGCLGAFAAGLGRLARESDRERTAVARAESACRELEKRLNRLTPPGAADNPGRRATAIRDENAAVQPFLSDIERLRGWWNGDDEDDDRDSRGESWRRLVDARNSYANALDRQVTHGEPAFFLAPQDGDGRPVLDRLERGPESCGAAARRLAAPDL